MVLKFLLHISKDEQRERLQERLDDPTKHWKFAAGDLEERKHWDAYQQAYSEAVAATGTPWAPWTDRAGRLEDAPQPDDRAPCVKQTLQALKLRYPPGDPALDEPASSGRDIRTRRGATMTDLSAEYKALADYRPTNKVRFVTAASLFDGHDAAINIMRRILQGMGAEVIHLGHNRSVDEVVTAALQEDVQGIAISSYQGGHVEYFKYMVDLLQAARRRAHPGVRRRRRRDRAGRDRASCRPTASTRIYSPEDGQRMGLAGMIGEMVMRCDHDLVARTRRRRWRRSSGHAEAALARARAADHRARERQGRRRAAAAPRCTPRPSARKTPVLGITGTGGAGKSSLTDELIRRLRLDQDDALRIAVISHRPVAAQERRRAARRPHPHERDRARGSGSGARASSCARWRRATSAARSAPRCPTCSPPCKAAGFDLVIVETSGIGQGDAAIVPLVDVPMYVMTPEFGAASQLEKIDMLDFAEFVAINKFDRKGARRRAARRRQAGAAQPRGVRQAARRDAGVRHDGEPLQRRRRDRAVPGAACRAWPSSA